LSRKNQWSPWYWDAWDADTKHLSHTQYSIYHRLLAHYYRTQRPLVANASGLARICYAVTTGELEDLALVLLQFFSKNDDGYHSKRADEELEKTSKINKVRQLSGRLGGLAKARKLLEQKSTQYNTYTNTDKNPTLTLPENREGTGNSRSNGTNPRKLGTNPRAQGTNPRAQGTDPRTVELIPKPPEPKCPKCGDTGVLHQLPHISGPRLIPCPDCKGSTTHVH
jgi:uncharacterized protein YdaU (DUF1376 family)